MIHEQHVEYRQLNILRVRFLSTLQENGGKIDVTEFKNILKCVMKNASKKLETLFITLIQGKGNTVDYQKLCEIINFYQYRLHFVKYLITHSQK